ncbi:MAG TPA: type II secretion system protein [Candidatus Saccharimonadales bacterium]
MIKKREQGFTLIELLVVSVIVGILATLVAMTYSGVQAKNRNADRQASINLLQSQLERYYALKIKYPSLSELNSAEWRKSNFKEFSDATIRDPQWNDKVTNCTADAKPKMAAAPEAKCYSYQATTTDGSPCVDANTACTQYTLTAIFEGGDKYFKTSVN